MPVAIATPRIECIQDIGTRVVYRSDFWKLAEQQKINPIQFVQYKAVDSKYTFEFPDTKPITDPISIIEKIEATTKTDSRGISKEDFETKIRIITIAKIEKMKSAKAALTNGINEKPETPRAPERRGESNEISAAAKKY